MALTNRRGWAAVAMVAGAVALSACAPSTSSAGGSGSGKPTRASSRPDSSSATMVFSNVGASVRAAIAWTSAEWRAMASR